MSRLLNWRHALVLIGMAACSPAALAQAVEGEGGAVSDGAAEPLMPLNLAVTSTRKPRRCGGTGANGEILVCGKDTGEDVRVPADETSTDDGLPRAPEVGPPSCKQTGSSKGCIGFGGVPPPVYVVDVKAIPRPPRGSDAEKVANGEISDR